MTISCPKCKHTNSSKVFCGGDLWLRCAVCNFEFYEDGFKRQSVYDLHMAKKRMKPSEQ
jgi:hypothetical protein